MPKATWWASPALKSARARCCRRRHPRRTVITRCSSASASGKRRTRRNRSSATARKPTRHRRGSFARCATDGSLQFNVGDKITVKEFQPGQYVDVIGTSKGKGFQGVVKRHHFRGGDATHGAKGWHRRAGAIGQRFVPGPRVQEHADAGPHGPHPDHDAESARRAGSRGG